MLNNNNMSDKNNDKHNIILIIKCIQEYKIMTIIAQE